MKTIEERIDAWLCRTIPVTPEGFKQRLEGALTELAADLNAEKEKEVAELRAWKESALKVMPDFKKLGKLLGLPLGSDVSEQLVPAVEKQTTLLNEVKRVLGEAQPHVCSLCCPSVKKDGEDWIHVKECEQITELLTRLGGTANE